MKVSDRKNVINIIEKRGYDYMPADFSMTPPLKKKFDEYIKQRGFKYKGSPFAYIYCRRVERRSDDFYRSLYKQPLKSDTIFDIYGAAQEAGSEDCLHLRRFYHPLKDAQTLDEIKAYPYPIFKKGIKFYHKFATKMLKMRGKFVMGGMQCTSWEQAWYIRSMESLMMDMLSEPDMANYLLDRITDNAVTDAENYVLAGVDAIYLGDDVGMQSTLLLSEELYIEYLKPRIKRVIDAARKINPKIYVFYHSCGYIEPLIPHLIEAGVNVLNPVQPESMCFKEIFKKYGDKLSFLGTIGTQTTMPFGTPEDVKKTVKENLDFVGSKGGLIVSPTHILEPEVPIENIIAYIEACREYKGNK